MLNKELIEEIKQDIKIHTENLTQDSLMTPELHQKYLMIFYHEKKILRKMENDFKKESRKVKDYYLGRADPEVYKERPFGLQLKGPEARERMEEDLSKDVEAIEEQKDLLSYLEKTINHIASRSFIISSILKDQEYKSGK